VAVLGDRAQLRHAAALAVDDAAVALDALTNADVLRVGEPLTFVHPLVGAAIYDDIPAGQRASAHLRPDDTALCATATADTGTLAFVGVVLARRCCPELRFATRALVRLAPRCEMISFPDRLSALLARSRGSAREAPAPDRPESRGQRGACGRAAAAAQTLAGAIGSGRIRAFGCVGASERIHRQAGVAGGQIADQKRKSGEANPD
jgi:hypothetical protein